jgi:hypothetical protein
VVNPDAERLTELNSDDLDEPGNVKPPAMLATPVTPAIDVHSAAPLLLQDTNITHLRGLLSLCKITGQSPSVLVPALEKSG